jgi:hypothetical protein
MSVLADLMSVTFLATGDDDQAIRNTFHVHNATDDISDQATLAGTAVDVYDYFKTTYRAMLTDGMTFEGVSVSQVVNPADPGEYLTQQHLEPVAGTRTGGSTTCPQEICAVLSEATPVSSRRFRGHMFLPPARLIAALSGSGFATGNAYWTAVSNFRSTFEDGMTGTATWTGTYLSHAELVCYSQRAATVGSDIVWVGIGSVSVRNRAHWLRSRGRGTT